MKGKANKDGNCILQQQQLLIAPDSGAPTRKITSVGRVMRVTLSPQHGGVFFLDSTLQATQLNRELSKAWRIDPALCGVTRQADNTWYIASTSQSLYSNCWIMVPQGHKLCIQQPLSLRIGTAHLKTFVNFLFGLWCSSMDPGLVSGDLCRFQSCEDGDFPLHTSRVFNRCSPARQAY